MALIVIMESNDSIFGDMREPCFEVSTDGFIHMITIDVEEIDGTPIPIVGHLGRGARDRSDTITKLKLGHMLAELA